MKHISLWSLSSLIVIPAVCGLRCSYPSLENFDRVRRHNKPLPGFDPVASWTSLVPDIENGTTVFLLQKLRTIPAFEVLADVLIEDLKNTKTTYIASGQNQLFPFRQLFSKNSLFILLSEENTTALTEEETAFNHVEPNAEKHSNFENALAESFNLGDSDSHQEKVQGLPNETIDQSPNDTTENLLSNDIVPSEGLITSREIKDNFEYQADDITSSASTSSSGVINQIKELADQSSEIFYHRSLDTVVPESQLRAKEQAKLIQDSYLPHVFSPIVENQAATEVVVVNDTLSSDINSIVTLVSTQAIETTQEIRPETTFSTEISTRTTTSTVFVTETQEVIDNKLPLYTWPLSTRPLTTDQCQVACMLHPECVTFLFYDGAGGVAPHCYLFDEALKKWRDYIGTNRHLRFGPKICPNYDFEDWDRDQVINQEDPCPLSSFQSTKTCPCSLRSSKYYPDALCKEQNLSLQLVPLKDLRARFDYNKHISAISLKECQIRCSEASRCVSYTYDQMSGCYLFKDSYSQFFLLHFGLGNELHYGTVSGRNPSSDHRDTLFPRAKDCDREQIRYLGLEIWSPVPLSKTENCQRLCATTRSCIGWSHTILGPEEGLCSIYNIIHGHEVNTHAVSGPKACNSCLVDSDGDGVFDCQDLCPFDYFKIYPGICGCNRKENPPFCQVNIDVEPDKLDGSESGLQPTNQIDNNNGISSAHMFNLETLAKIKANLKAMAKHQKRFLKARRQLAEVQKPCFNYGQNFDLTHNELSHIPNKSPVVFWIEKDGTQNMRNPRTPVDPEECQLICQRVPECLWWSFELTMSYGCNLYTSSATYNPQFHHSGTTIVSGPKFCKGSCDDGIRNRDEEMIDCGGAYCSPCGSLCTDQKLNQNEDDVDCGGVCKQCSTSQ